MNLPTSAQVLAATRHVASFAAGAIAMFGLSTKINPDQVTAIINSFGTFVSDAVVLIGLITPVVAGYIASQSASPASQITAVAANPDVSKIITTPAIAAANPSDKVVSH
jgi:hypothetical protein